MLLHALFTHLAIQISAANVGLFYTVVCIPSVTVTDPWAAQPGGVGDVPPTFGTSGVQGLQTDGPMKMIFASTADNSVLYK